jgi:hypothetical protein
MQYLRDFALADYWELAFSETLSDTVSAGHKPIILDEACCLAYPGLIENETGDVPLVAEFQDRSCPACL